jgi:iron complex transport system substrate-binding protein
MLKSSNIEAVDTGELMDHGIFVSLAVCIIFLVLAAGCISQQKAPPPESIPGPSIIDLEDLAASSSGILLTDSIGREVIVPRNITHVICSGPGCMRYLAYLQGTGMGVSVDPVERDTRSLLPLAYLAANPEIRMLPSIMKENEEINVSGISDMNPHPDLILLMGGNHLISADDLQKRTGIPVLILQEGDLSFRRSTMNYTLRVMGVVLSKSERAEEVIQFFDKVTDNLQTRSWTIPDFQRKTGYIGGYSYPDPQGLYSTTSVYIPFNLVKIQNTAEGYAAENNLSGSFLVPKEALARMVPDAIFIDMTTWARKESALTDLEKSDLLQGMPAVREGEVYGLLPTALYGEEHEADLINAYYIGKALYPDKFTDVEPRVMADYVYAFLYGEPLFEEMNRGLGGMTLSRIPLFT